MQLEAVAAAAQLFRCFVCGGSRSLDQGGHLALLLTLLSSRLLQRRYLSLQRCCLLLPSFDLLLVLAPQLLALLDALCSQIADFGLEPLLFGNHLPCVLVELLHPPRP